MTRRVNLAKAVVVPWEVPEIDLFGDPEPAEHFLELELPSLDPKGWRREAQQPAEAAPATDAGKMQAQAKEPADAVKSAAERGHAEGFDRGLVEGREKGFAEGFIIGRRAAEKAAADEARRLEAIARRLAEPIRALERPVEEAVLALAIEVARSVIGAEIATSRDYLVRLIREAVAKVPIDIGTPKIVLHPEDVALVRRLAPDLEHHGITLIEDASIESGGCIIMAEGDDGAAAKDRRWHPRVNQGLCQIDLTLASRWRDVMLALFEGEEL